MSATLFHENRSGQNPANRSAADLQLAGDVELADAGAVQFPDFRSVCGRSCRTTQPFAILPGLSQASPSPLA